MTILEELAQQESDLLAEMELRKHLPASSTKAIPFGAKTVFGLSPKAWYDAGFEFDTQRIQYIWSDDTKTRGITIYANIKVVYVTEPEGSIWSRFDESSMYRLGNSIHVQLLALQYSDMEHLKKVEEAANPPF